MERINDKLINWATQIEPGTIRQAEMTARLPVVERVALMPDAHIGMGATVGSVIGTQGAVIPAAVGVDIGCTDRETEFLSPTGWKRIDQWDKDRVLQVDCETGMGDFVQPIAYIRRPSRGFYHFKTKYGVDQMVSPDHRMPVIRMVTREARDRFEVIRAADLQEEHERLVQGSKVRFETACSVQTDSKLDLSADQIRLMVAVMADGSFPGNANTCYVRLKKERKIERLHHLLSMANIDYRTAWDGDVTRFRFQAPVREKSYRSWWSASAEQLGVIADECIYWDGNDKDQVFFTRDEDSADFIQYAFMTCGYRAVKRGDNAPDGRVDYRVFRHANSRVGIAGVPKTPVQWVEAEGHEEEFCFQVPTSFWVMRRNGQIAITGNCGMAAVEFDLSAGQLPDDLERFLPDVERAIPAGVGEGHAHVTQSAERWWKAHKSDFTSRLENPLVAKLKSQFGSLGSGNHFFEVCLDERDRVWIVLHSGSRGLGNKLAQRHIKDAKALMVQKGVRLEDKDLSYFEENDEGFNLYIGDMLACQDYARGNRDLMLDRSVAAFRQFMGREVPIVQTINCHHNFTQREVVDGEELWITRKGAIKADVGDLGIIPGSMGTRSYIVEGLGNPLSYNSCSHGAGRVHSRSAAKRLFTQEQLEEAMKGKVWNSNRASHLIDESPMAYRDIEQVMRDQSDLVRPLHTLSQVLNFKGQ